MALRHAEQSGEGQVVDVSLIESVLAVTESLIPEYGADGTVRERTAQVSRYRTIQYLHDERWALPRPSRKWR